MGSQSIIKHKQLKTLNSKQAQTMLLQLIQSTKITLMMFSLTTMEPRLRAVIVKDSCRLVVYAVMMDIKRWKATSLLMMDQYGKLHGHIPSMKV